MLTDWGQNMAFLLYAPRITMLSRPTGIGNDRTLHIKVRPDGRTSSLWVRPDAGPDRTGSSGRTYRRTVTGPITGPRPDPKTGPTSDDVLEWFP